MTHGHEDIHYDPEIIPESLKELRKKRSLSQYDFAVAAGIREKSYWQYETGRVLPPLDKLILLMNTHSITAEELFGVRPS